ncbi:hypothetical protein BX600DRAFT_471791 [Xylariales sp. PMI_506]|nr:hypothetical protein BX600DRAFT_471791 [Xylariales sp. PMI_506]
MYNMYMEFMDSPQAPASGTHPYASCCLDVVQVLCMGGMVNMMPVAMSAQSHTFDSIFEIVRWSERLYHARMAFTSRNGSALDFTVEPGVVAPLYYACVYAPEPELKATALELLSKYNVREGPWDGKALVEVIRRCNIKDQEAVLSDSQAKLLPRWGSDMDCYELFSELVITEW